MLKLLWKVIYPQGPIGQWLSPSEVYKDRLGLPVSSPHTIRATVQAPGDIERAFAPARFVSMEDAIDVPKGRVRHVSAYIEERWSPVYASTTSTDMFEIIKASQTQIGWTVTQQQTQASKARPSAEQFIEIAQSCHIQASDEYLNGYYETIPGNDPLVIDGKTVTGGTRITGGRREYREKTQGMIHWDAGFVKERERALAIEAQKGVQGVRAEGERIMGERMPTYRRIPNGMMDKR